MTLVLQGAKLEIFEKEEKLLDFRAIRELQGSLRDRKESMAGSKIEKVLRIENQF